MFHPVTSYAGCHIHNCSLSIYMLEPEESVTRCSSHTQIYYVTGQHGYTTFAKYCRVAQASKLEYTIESLQHPILVALIGGRVI